MTVEITSVNLNDGVVTITAIDCSEENLQRLERLRDDGIEREVKFLIDTHNQKDYCYLSRWLKRQKATAQARTWGEALHSIYGTVTTINGKYRVWDYS